MVQFIAKFITFRVMYNMRKLYFSQDYILFYSGSGKSKFSFVQFQKKKNNNICNIFRCKSSEPKHSRSETKTFITSERVSVRQQFDNR